MKAASGRTRAGNPARQERRPVQRPTVLGDNAARAYLQGRSLRPADLWQVQRIIGNRACVELLTPRRPAVQREEVANQFYGHGAFMGAAPRMMADHTWRSILRVLMPDVSAAAEAAGPEDLIPMMENNPVMAAYGMLETQTLDAQGKDGRSDRLDTLRAIEWDVWVNHDILMGYRAAGSETALRTLDEALVNTMLIAHGAKPETVFETFSRPQYPAVRATPKAKLGGARGSAWMDLFGKALQLAASPDIDTSLTEMQEKERHDNKSDQSSYNTFKSELTFPEVIKAYKNAFPRKEAFSVILDIKSADIDPWSLRRLILELNRRGVHVNSVGTFTPAQLKNLDKIDQDVAGQMMGKPRGIHFVHGIGNLQRWCVAREIFRGDNVMFNAGSILDSVAWEADHPDAKDPEIDHIISRLSAFKDHYGFRLGLYVQEGSTDRRAARKLIHLSNKHASLFDLGFAWGGLADEVGPVNSGGSGMGAQASYPRNKWKDSRMIGAAP